MDMVKYGSENHPYHMTICYMEGCFGMEEK